MDDNKELFGFGGRPLPGGSGPIHGASGGSRVCEACKRAITDQNSVYGSGRFCSQNCSKLRTPERHWDWLLEHPDELKIWQEAEQKYGNKLPGTVRMNSIVPLL